MHALAALPAAVPALGPKWMDPAYLLQQYGGAFFWIAIAIVFIECGLLFPILPGDSLLFAVGLFIATGQVHINLGVAILALCAAAFLGNVVGYEIGRAIGTPLYERDRRILKKKYFDQTEEFFDRHGNKALVIGRFVPFVRTYVTVVAGVTRMERHRFFLWSFVGGKPMKRKPKDLKRVLTTSPESDAMSKALQKAGFKFVGSTICYAFMQASGMVDDHVVGCHCAKE